MSAEEQVGKGDAAKSDFMAAQEIKAILTGRDAIEQERIIRWVGESLGLTLHLRAKPAPQHGHSDEVEPAPADPGAGSRADSDEPRKPQDIKSFVQSKQPKSDMQFVAVVAYYHRFLATPKKEFVTTDDIQEGGRQSGRGVFSTPRTPLNNAVAQGYLDRGTAPGEFRLNAVGENLVAMTLPGGSGAASEAAPRKRKPNGGKAKGKKKVKGKRAA
jgi:hypothetical protein